MHTSLRPTRKRWCGRQRRNSCDGFRPQPDNRRRRFPIRRRNEQLELGSGLDWGGRMQAEQTLEIAGDTRAMILLLFFNSFFHSIEGCLFP